MRLMLRLTAWSALLDLPGRFRRATFEPARRDHHSTGSCCGIDAMYGIALAAVMTIHLVLLLIVNEQAFKITGAIVYSLLFLMLFTSFDGAPAKIGPRNWRVLHKAGCMRLVSPTQRRWKRVSGNAVRSGLSDTHRPDACRHHRDSGCAAFFKVGTYKHRSNRLRQVPRRCPR